MDIVQWVVYGIFLVSAATFAWFAWQARDEAWKANAANQTRYEIARLAALVMGPVSLFVRLHH